MRRADRRCGQLPARHLDAAVVALVLPLGAVPDVRGPAIAALSAAAQLCVDAVLQRRASPAGAGRPLMIIRLTGCLHQEPVLSLSHAPDHGAAGRRRALPDDEPPCLGPDGAFTVRPF